MAVSSKTTGEPAGRSTAGSVVKPGAGEGEPPAAGTPVGDEDAAPLAVDPPALPPDVALDTAAPLLVGVAAPLGTPLGTADAVTVPVIVIVAVMDALRDGVGVGSAMVELKR